ncbi:MAG: hypothetical protein QM664_04330 [Flavihumibacter sp.]
MKRYFSIKTLAGYLLLALFAFSAAPKQLLHEWLAEHEDEVALYAVHGKPLVKTAGFHCDCKFPVVHTPFHFSEAPALPPAPVAWFRHSFCQELPVTTVDRSTGSYLRGPPAASLFV